MIPIDKFFWGVEQCSADKKTAAYRSRKDTHRLTLPLRSNGLIFTGTLLTGASASKHPCATKPMYDDCQLVALDFDLMPTLKNQWELPMTYLDQWIGQETFLVRTGSGSLHAYFLIPDLRHVVHNTQRNLPLPGTEFLRTWGVECVDVRGYGGVLFAPGTKFQEHKWQYTILRDIMPLRLALADFLTLLKQVVTQLPDVEDVFKSKHIAKKRIKDNRILLPFTTSSIELPSINDLYQSECCGFNLGEFIYGKIQHDDFKKSGIPNAEIAVWGAVVRKLSDLHYTDKAIINLLIHNIPWSDPKTVEYQVLYKFKRPEWRQKAITRVSTCQNKN